MFKNKHFKPLKGLQIFSTLVAIICSSQASSAIFISEFHYDNTGGDVGEFVEISGDTGASLDGWSVVFYNGANGTSYRTLDFDGSFVFGTNSGCGAGGTLVRELPTNGIQNGAPDGIALVDNNGNVIEFLSYEGQFSASNGPANTLPSTNIGVSESSGTPIGHSLQLVNGVWSAPTAETKGDCSTDVGSYNPTPPVVATPTPTPTPAATPTGTPSIFFSEFHYDNSGTDINEAIEISGPTNLSLTGWSVALYNGANSSLYNTINLSGSTISAAGCGTSGGVIVIHFPSNGLQNGAPDGFALIDDNGSVVEFISYEGSLTAVNGPASGLTSINVGVSESSSTLTTESIQLINGTWAAPSANTFGSCSTDINAYVPTAPISPNPTPTPTPTLTPTPTPTPVIEAKIHEIQGNGSAVTSESVFQVEAIVIGDYQDSDQLKGFFIQEEDADADTDASTSEGIFVYCDTCPVDVAVGDLVRVTGLAGEFFDMSQISARFSDDVSVLTSDQGLPTPASISLPVVTTASDLAGATTEINAFYEAFEGMLVTFLSELTVTEYFELARFGQVVLSSDGRPRQFTDMSPPSESGFIAHQIDVASRKVILDDDNNIQNDPLFNNKPIFHPQPGFSLDKFFRGGDTISDLTGILHWSYPGAGANTWRIRPVVTEFDYSFTRSNPRPKAPSELGGDLKVASFNVLNYFTTIDEGNSVCGANGTLGCRGAHSAQELERQTQKIVAAICAIDADIVGLMELENLVNNTGVSAIESLVNALNQHCGTYDFINTGTVGTDAITVGMIYRPDAAIPVGTAAVLDTNDFVDSNNVGSPKNRPAVAQTFNAKGKGKEEKNKDGKNPFYITVVVNHLKSKGSSCGSGDDDTSTGQGNCNTTRTRAAEVEAAWLETNPTGVETKHILILGDLNAYRFEDPITALINAGYYDLTDYFHGADSYGYVFDGQLGYLDYALATRELKGRVVDIIHWNINADEVNVLDYNDEVQDSAERSFEPKPSALPLFSPNAYRSSDHDPVVIGIQTRDHKEPKVEQPLVDKKEELIDEIKEVDIKEASNNDDKKDEKKDDNELNITSSGSEKADMTTNNAATSTSGGSSTLWFILMLSMVALVRARSK